MKILKEFFSSLKKEEVLPEEEDTSPKLVNIPSEDMKPIVDVYKNIISLRFEIGKTMVEHREVEDVMFSQVKKKQKQMDELVHKLKEKYDIPVDDESYVLNLPHEKNEKGTFIKEKQ